MIIKENSFMVNMDVPEELAQQVIREFKLWDYKALQTEYTKLLRKIPFILSDIIVSDASTEEEPYLMKVIELLKQTHDVLATNIFEHKEVQRPLLIFSILLMRDMYILGSNNEAGGLSAILTEGAKRYKGET